MMKLLNAVIGFAVILTCVDAAKLSKAITLSPAMQTFITDLHNNYRSSVANGKVAGQPKAADMLAMTWDAKLAAFAQTNVNKCEFNHSDRKVTGFASVGENMSAGTMSAAIKGDDDLKADFQSQFQASKFKGVDTWTDENTKFTYPACQAGKVCGHYTQLVWGASNKVGCAIAECKGLGGGWSQPETQLTYLILCNYAPAGNMGVMNGTKIVMPAPYKSGAPCSSCPTTAKTCSKLGLCA